MTRRTATVTRRVNSPPRRYNGTQSACADINCNHRHGFVDMHPRAAELIDLLDLQPHP